MNSNLLKTFVLLSAFICLNIFTYSADAQQTNSLIIFHAGSLSVPFKEMAKAFTAKNPGVQIIREAAGSRTCARKIVDLGRPCDIIASADYTVIENILIPAYASWNISFATNEMAIMYRTDSRDADRINTKNWYKILLQKGVEYGHSDPDTDPCGYRSQLVWQLAERYYHVPGLYEQLRKYCPPKNIRPKETDLIALLEAGQIDYLFIYRSVCMQHKMPFVKLPEQINLGSSRYTSFYKQASIRISGKTPHSFTVKRGMPMIYGITIPKNAPHKILAIRYVAFVLSKRGKQIMKQNGQTPLIVPQVTGKASQLPTELKRLVQRQKHGGISHERF